MKKRIQKLNKEQIKELLGNNKGLSLAELCVVIAIMAALIIVVSGSISIVFKARAKSAAEKIGSIVSQCKINSLSGIDNEFTLLYDNDKKQYVCTLAKKSDSDEYDDIYKEEMLGNSRVNITIDGNSVLDGAILKIKFSNNDGGVEVISVKAADDTVEDLIGEPSNIITVSSSRTYQLTLYTYTGEHEIEMI